MKDVFIVFHPSLAHFELTQRRRQFRIPEVFHALPLDGRTCCVEPFMALAVGKHVVGDLRIRKIQCLRETVDVQLHFLTFCHCARFVARHAN